MKKMYICIYDPNTGFTELSNVGFFLALSKEDAVVLARKQWNTSGRIYAELVADCHNGWSYYS